MAGTILAVLDDDGLLGTRYPQRLDGPSGEVTVRGGSPHHLADSAARAVIVDSRREADVQALLDRDLPMLVGISALAAADRGDRNPLPSTSGWLPFLPVRDSVDVRAGADLIAGRAIGAPLACQLTTYVGRVAADPRWEQDAPFARSTLEALVFGLDLLETLLGDTVSETTWSALTGTSAGVARHDATIPVTQWVVPAPLGVTPLFTATVVTERGRLLLRHEFAPGAVTVWDARTQAFRSPALDRGKHNVQAPDTAVGGTEAAVALNALLESRDPPAEPRQRAVRLVRHARAALSSTGGLLREEPR